MIRLTDGTFYSPTSITDLLHHHRQIISSLLLSFPRQGWSLIFFKDLYILKQHLVNSVLCSEYVFMCDVKSCSRIFSHNFAEFRGFFLQHLRVTFIYRKQPYPSQTPRSSLLSCCSQRHPNPGLPSTQELLLLSKRKTELHLEWHVFRHVLKQKHVPKYSPKTNYPLSP